MVARIQKGYKAGNTLVGGMLTSANRYFADSSLQFLSKNVYTGGIDFLQHWKDKKYFIDASLIGSYINGSTEAITALQESSARYYQRPGADYLNFDTTRTNLNGYGGKFRIGKKSKGYWRYSTGVTWLSPGLELNDLGYMIYADEIDQQNVVSYFINQPASIFLHYNLNLEQFNTWNFNGDYLGSGTHFSFSSLFKNQWSLETNLILHSQSLNTKILRGGYDMIMPYNISTVSILNTDKSKKIVAMLEYSYEHGGNNYLKSHRVQPGITVRPVSSLKIVLSASYERNNNELQYVTNVDFSTEKRYILALIDQTTLGLTFRADLNLTPEFSIQYYGSPFVSRGAYSEYKHVTNPLAKEYAERYDYYDNVVFSNGKIIIDENGDHITDYSISNPDFNFFQFRSNFVAKWEYRLGSFIYFVWSSERTGKTGTSGASLGDSYRELFSVHPKNIFLIKLSYWFSL